MWSPRTPAPVPLWYVSGAWAIIIRFRKARVLPRADLSGVRTFQIGRKSPWWVRFAADTPVGISGCRRKFTAFALEAEIPALSREGATEALGGQLDFSRDVLTLRKQGADIPPKVNQTGL